MVLKASTVPCHTMEDRSLPDFAMAVVTSVWLLLLEHPVLRLAASIRQAPIPINFFILIPPVFPYFKCTFTVAFIPNTRGRSSLFSMVTLMGISCVTLV